MPNRSLLPAALAAMMALAAAAQAAHMTQYATNPVEHDDQGRSNEPDGAATGPYLGVAVRDCTLDLDGDGRCTAADLAAWPPGQRVAQGCTDDSGRQLGGLCGLRTVLGLPATIDIIGPCNLPTAHQRVRFVDVRQSVYLHGPGISPTVFEVNRKLEDIGWFYLEQQMGLAASDVVAGPTAMLAWYGYYLDKNCNGVIDHYGGQQADPRNEFTWIGSCKTATGSHVVHRDVCLPEQLTFLGWEVPGNHHAIFRGVCAVTCTAIPADLPGSLVVCEAANRLPLSPGFVLTTHQGCDAEEGEYYGDPLLGDQGRLAPDWYFYDYTGDPSVGTRTYVAANNWPMFHYDQSLVVTSVVVGAVNPPQDGSATEYDLREAHLVDVDVLSSRNPLVENFVTGVVKPAARGTWLTVRPCLEPADCLPL